MKLRKRIGWALLVLVMGIQFVRPERNNSEQSAATGFIRSFGVPDNIAFQIMTNDKVKANIDQAL